MPTPPSSLHPRTRSRQRHGGAIAPLHRLLALLALALAACAAPVDPGRLSLERLETEAGTPYARAFGANVRGDATVLVCGVASPASLTVVLDEHGAVVPESERSGRTIRFRVPDLGTDPLDCDVDVEQQRGTGSERATLAKALAYRAWLPLAGTRVLMYTSIYAGNGDNNARARFASAVASVEAAQQLDLTIVDGTTDAYLDGSVATEFAERLAAGSWDAVVFLEEQYIVETPVLDAIRTYLNGGSGRALGSYWATFEDGEFAAFGLPRGSVGGPARALAATFGAHVTPADNVHPVSGGSIGIALQGRLLADLPGAYQLINEDYYTLSYAQRLKPIGAGESLCVYPDALGGSCAVGNAAGTSLFLGFTLAPLSESMSGGELEVLFRNALEYVVLTDE